MARLAAGATRSRMTQVAMAEKHDGHGLGGADALRKVPLLISISRESNPQALSTFHFVSIADFGFMGALGESDNVSHMLKPDGRSCASNSQ